MERNRQSWEKTVSIGSHQSSLSGRTDWLTPPNWIDALGQFDLDPCVAETMPWPTAPVMWSRTDDGLRKDWFGRVWCNPPYGPPKIIEPWMARMAHHKNGIALIFARTETACWFKYVWPVATAVLFVKGRPHFHDVTGRRAIGNSGGPVALIAYTERDARSILASGIQGKMVVANENDEVCQPNCEWCAKENSQTAKACES